MGEPATLADRESAARAEVFRQNLHGMMSRRGITARDLRRRALLATHVCARWLKHGVARPNHEQLISVGRLLGLEDPFRLFDPRLLDDEFCDGDEITPAQRLANPSIEEVRTESPDLFSRFSKSDWREIYSIRGTGGSLTPEGVARAAEHINAKRELRRKFEALLETEHFSTLVRLIELMYRDASVPSS